ncbi:hydroxyacid dehydrogenase [Neorhizobium sp. P12A]|uniref:2-hydroxyacid dehydrogenase n=1 Tax=Neorhizobium sp. P12A TaxID=2268027 RepID=UPI0011EF827A|nr:2-hydroxyacid dehydrogenase [Neorhizobium sp. P12A]KAA0693365.1 hydroxyacid dehydrogenase [Neorhizobium sp. P12A]
MKILFADTLYAQYMPEIRKAVAEDAEWCVASPSDPLALEQEIADADIFVGSKLPASLVAGAKALKLVVCSASGTNGIAIDALPEHVAVTNTYHHEQSISEYVMMSVVALSRGLLQADSALRQGRWRSVFYDSSRRPHHVLAGQTIGLIGLGHMGTAVAKLAKAFGMRVIATRRNAAAGEVSEAVDEVRGSDQLAWLLQEARFVVVCAPLTSETRDLLGPAQLRLIGPDGFLINVGRAEIVNEEALFQSLLTRVIAGAAVDVWYNYPDKVDGVREPSSFPFRELDNIIMTPHHSGQAEENFRARAGDIAYNIGAFLSGKSLRNTVSRK